MSVGPMDLSTALGVFQRRSHPKHQDAIRGVAEAALKWPGKTSKETA